jgi:hypothetical protein
MPSRKQRRRRAKERRHDYEFVYVDEEGREVEVDPDDAKAPKQRAERRAQPTTRSGRTVLPPSWQRVGKRALLFGPLMFITIRILEKKETLATSLVRTLFLLLLFLPFSYVMDTMLYRSYVRRTNRQR